MYLFHLLSTGSSHLHGTKKLCPRFARYGNRFARTVHRPSSLASTIHGVCPYHLFHEFVRSLFHEAPSRSQASCAIALRIVAGSLLGPCRHFPFPQPPSSTSLVIVVPSTSLCGLSTSDTIRGKCGVRKVITVVFAFGCSSLAAED